MNFDYTEKMKSLQEKLTHFMKEHVYPIENDYFHWTHSPENFWKVWPGLEDLKAKAHEKGLWNLFLPANYGEVSPGLSNLEYAPLAEIMGKVIWSSEIFNCSAPDTGNMEVLAKYGNHEQQERWLKPLLAGKIRSAFLMTEPEVASSDATNIQCSIKAEGDEYVINGRKWWSSGAMDPRCEIFIVMGKTDPEAARHSQQSMILVPKNTPGVTVVRPLSVFGEYDSPAGHAEVLLENVRVPKSHLILGEGRGFEIAQGRLGPGRIHHCMRLIGMAQRALELMSQRVATREAFGRPIAAFSSIRQDVSKSLCEIQQARLLTLQAADMMDKAGTKGAKELISMIKIVAPRMTQTVVDRAMQSFGGMGLSADTPLAGFFGAARVIRLADGPDEVHMHQLGKNTIMKYATEATK
ncbi:acyl-CoA dehydrogenase family protein [Microscilla marina]|uniref:Acyl-CoA dehydrogenase, C-terminal:Acyl-CoA dehydrogenase, central region n=1 Tax=Microscilla marina ATCC 23134 TaxID=313606 RepID=A1ZCM9_MICM2|nr:acyl-CoA dehydrogenase family protein [Microscilla marina]EAY32031.1 acyl-CoA dehydrogenase, C-terminal:Acyl-CoA dehydrogenase, central region [Microscilla marina ATCC 23134]